MKPHFFCPLNPNSTLHTAQKRMGVDKRDLALDDVVRQDHGAKVGGVSGGRGGAMRGGGSIRGGGAMRGRGNAGMSGARAAASPYQRSTPQSVLWAANFARQAAMSASANQNAFPNPLLATQPQQLMYAVAAAAAHAAAAATATGGGRAFTAAPQHANPFAAAMSRDGGLFMHGGREQPQPAAVNPQQASRSAAAWHAANPQPAAKNPAAGAAQQRPTELSTQRQQRPTELSTAGTKMLVSNLGAEVTSEDLQELFEEHGGPLKKKAVVFYDQNGSSLGQGEVVFRRRADAEKALETLNGVPLDARPLQLALVGVASAPARDDLRGSLNPRQF